MAAAELTIFVTPGCPVCRELEEALKQRGVAFRLLDVSADREALVLLLRYAGHPLVPTVVAYGEVMVGFDRARLDHLLEGLEDRAEAWTRRNAEEEEQLSESERFVQAFAREAIALRQMADAAAEAGPSGDVRGERDGDPS